MAKKKPAKDEAASVEHPDFSRPPRPLPAGCTGDRDHDTKLDVIAMLTGDALDVGEQRWDDAKAKALPLKERRLYRALADAAYSGENERRSWLAAMMAVAAKTPKGRARLTEIARSDVHPLARQLAADALFVGGAQRPELEAIATLYDIPGDPNELVQAHRRGARAILMLDRANAFEKLSPEAGRGAVLFGLLDVGKAIDERWLDLLLALVPGEDLGGAFGAMQVLTNLDPDPRMADAVLTHFGPDPEKTFYTNQAIKLLERCGDARAVPYLVSALVRSSYWHFALDALQAIGDPSAIHGIRAWRARNDVPTNAGWPGFAAADAVIAYLETRGPVPDAPPPPPPKAPGPRQVRKLRPAPKVSIPKAETIERQKKAIVTILEEQQLGHRADALIRNAIAIFPRRAKEASLKLGASRMGGRPDLPKGMKWPRLEDNVFGFIAQLDLAEIAPLDIDQLLPKKGLLSLFIMDEHEGGYLDHALVIHFDDVSSLVRADVPEDFDRRPPETVIREPYAPCSLTFRSHLTLPSASNPSVAEMLTKEELERYQALEWLAEDQNQLLGWRSQGYDETSPDTRVLFQCTSDDQAAMEWGDVETLALLIDDAALRAGDFSSIRPYIGD